MFYILSIHIVVTSFMDSERSRGLLIIQVGGVSFTPSNFLFLVYGKVISIIYYSFENKSSLFIICIFIRQVHDMSKWLFL